MILLFLYLFIQNPVDQPFESHLQMREADLSQLAEILTILRRHSVIKPSRRLSSDAINGLLQALDPHSDYFNADAYQELKASQAGSFFGIGIRVLKHHSHLFVSEVKPKSPAAKAGLEWGDEITFVEGIETHYENMQELINRIRGKRGSSILFKVKKFNSRLEIEIPIIREEIKNTNVSETIVLPSEDGTERAGLIVLNDFGETSGTEVRTALLQLLAQGCTYIVLDLRNNPGGLLQQAIECANLFLPPSSVVVSIQGRFPHDTHSIKTSTEEPLYIGPMAILINQGTASAAEIVAGALQDHDRALLLGSQSWGKGLVQSVFAIPPGETGLALTTARYVTPLGRDIQGSYKDIYAYLQPDSGEAFFFREKIEEESFVTTQSGRKLYSSRGIGPDIFYYNHQKILAQIILTHKHSLALFILMHPHLKPYQYAKFSSEFSLFFETHSGFLHQALVDQSILRELYKQYQVFMTETVLNIKTSSRKFRNDPLIVLALKTRPQAESMRNTCFNHQPLPSQTIQAFLELSMPSNTKSGKYN